ncbi:MAG: beta-ketoacyl-[acyl-carrier-protein] synthase family protein [Gammaproteobacteria bacterium]|nr:beta-ketoacyl-[acyl-carrier-protein] synthase family protein [Gammaproteobacteria bacterium]
MNHLQITDYTLTTALGAGVDVNVEHLHDGCSGLHPCEFFDISDLRTWVGEVAGLDEIVIDRQFSAFDCRNNRLALKGLKQDGFIESVQQAVSRYGAARVGVFIGTSTSGVHQTEKAYLSRENDTAALPDWYQYETTQNTYSVAEFVRAYTGCDGVSVAISTACSSSAKVFASAYRAIHSGLCDAAIVGGVDSLCLTTLYGFNSLQLLSEEPCRPSDIARNGISIGEAAGFALLQRPQQMAGVGLFGYGESSDAFHMSSPHPEGDGAYLAMQAALHSAALNPEEIDYINLHGTATVANDFSEAKAISRLFGNKTPSSSTKGWTGHTLGAAGIVEVIFSLMSLKQGYIPPTLNTQQIDPGIKINILMEGCSLRVKTVLSNSFGFGGSNVSLIVGEIQ